MKIILFDKRQKKNISAKIDILNDEEFNKVFKDSRFSFNWNKEKSYLTIKVYLEKNNNILGLMSLNDIAKELRIEIRLLEVSKENTGKNKEIDRIAGCLIAYACRMAFDKGYFGFVSLIPKTKLVNHYVNTYGFVQYGRHLALELESADRIIRRYLNYGK